MRSIEEKLYNSSMKIILQNQAESGAYIACPNFKRYRYSWFRDGAFIAYSMDLWGNHQSSRRFHNWAARVIETREGIIERAIRKVESNFPLNENEIIHTRYTVDGEEGKEQWENFQLDGLGTWLWALKNHLLLSETEPSASFIKASRLVGDYLQALWRLPCYDLWEEFPHKIHTYTLASIYAGLESEAFLNSTDRIRCIEQIKEFIYTNSIIDGHFVKHVQSSEVDSSLLGLAVPYSVFPPEDSLIKNTVLLIEEKLVSGNGVHRYSEDSYYGGGLWILLTGWLGWYYVQVGNTERANRLKRWMEKQSDSGGQLPEQIPQFLNRPSCYQYWVEKCGPVAKPLLWAHAMYLILLNVLSGKE